MYLNIYHQDEICKSIFKKSRYTIVKILVNYYKLYIEN